MLFCLASLAQITFARFSSVLSQTLDYHVLLMSSVPFMEERNCDAFMQSSADGHGHACPHPLGPADSAFEGIFKWKYLLLSPDLRNKQNPDPPNVQYY